jgi:hypothetical protein
MTYVLTCLVSFSKKCRDFLEEWNSVVSNKWILSKGFEYLPFWEETAANIILWRRKVKENYGRIFVNTLFADVVHHVESNENIKDINIFGNENQYCQDSSKIQFYHGIKSKEELEKIKFI